MSKIVLFVAFAAGALSLISASGNPVTEDNLTGAWILKNGSEEDVLVFTDGYFTQSQYDKGGKRFIATRGGSYTAEKNKLTVRYEFDTRDKEQVGAAATYAIDVKDKALFIDVNGSRQQFTNLDKAGEGLSGLWTITARKQGDALQPIHQSGTRKTVKILTATRFQWAAIDPGTKQFMGTGGGTYTFRDGKYTEHIEFFSRDSSRVGSSLSFDGRLENGDWHHSGLSSRGEPIHEVWSRKL